MSITKLGRVRDHNKQQLLQALLASGPLSRAELAERTSLSSVTVTSISRELSDSGLIVEIGKTEGQAGRPAGIYDLHPRLGTLVGVDVQPQELRLVTSDLRGQGRQLTVLPVQQSSELDEQLRAWLQTTLATPPNGPLCQVTIAFPAPISLAGERLEPNSLPTVTLQATQQLLQRSGVEFALENDANLHALAEKYDGAARAEDSFIVLMQRESGIGMGLYLDGSLFRGQHGRAGELALARWPVQAQAVPIEELEPETKEQALTYLVGGVAASLDIPLLILTQQAKGARPLPIPAVLPHLRVVRSTLGPDGPSLGALAASRERAARNLLTDFHIASTLNPLMSNGG